MPSPDIILTNNGTDLFTLPDWALLANDKSADGNNLTIFSQAWQTTDLFLDHGGGQLTIGDKAPLGASFQYTAYDGTTASPTSVTLVNQAGGNLVGSANYEILVGSAAGETINGGGGKDLIFGGGDDDAVIFHAGDKVQGGSDSVLPSGGLAAVGGRGDVLAIGFDVDFTNLDLARFDGIETLSLLNVESGGAGAQALTIGASNVLSLSDHTITPGGVFGEHAAVRIDADVVDQLYLSISKDGGSWSDTGISLAGYQVYAHDGGAGADAYVMVAAANTGNVHLNQDAP